MAAGNHVTAIMSRVGASSAPDLKVTCLAFDFAERCIPLANAVNREAQFHLLLPDHIAAPHISKLKPTVNFQPFMKPRLRQPLRQIRLISSLLQCIRRFDPDIIHFHHGHLWFNLALPLLRRYPLVLTIYDPRHHVGDKSSQKTPQMIMDFGFHRATQVIVHSQQSKKMAVDVCRIPGEIIHVIPIIGLGDEAPQNLSEEDDHLILFFGRIWAYKGLEFLIRAEPFITAQVPDAKIMIAGEGEDFARYRRMMVHPEHFIVQNEHVSHEQRTRLFQRASVVVLPYIDATQSGVILDAYTFAKPVVATTVGGLTEAVDHGRTGFLVPPRDEQALADAIVRLLRDKALRQQLGQNGRRKIDTESSPEAVAQQTLAVYHRAISGAAGVAQSSIDDRLISG